MLRGKYKQSPRCGIHTFASSRLSDPLVYPPPKLERSDNARRTGVMPGTFVFSLFVLLVLLIGHPCRWRPQWSDGEE